MQPLPKGYEAVSRSVAGTMVSESTAWVQACLLKTVLLGLKLLEDFIT